MAPRRVPLQDISGNIKRRRELTPYERAEIVGASKCRLKPGQIAKHLPYSRRTIRSTILQAGYCKNRVSKPQSGRLPLWGQYKEQVILRVVCQFPKFNYKQIQAFTGLKYCDKTIQKILRKHHIVSWRAKKRLALTKQAAKDRYHWCKA